jgi:hypothetical protein
MGKGLESIEKEIAGEKAAALGRGGRNLKAALDKLQRFDEDAAAGGRRGHVPAARAELVEGAGEALWAYIVQREAVGLVDAEYIRKEYNVPADVWMHMSPKMEQAEQERRSPGSTGNKAP